MKMGFWGFGFFVCDAGWSAVRCAGIRDAVGFFAFALASAMRLVFLPLRWHPRYAFVLHASPLCGAAPTFLCRRKEK
ncbi:hypothetical protein [Paraburkholderia terrae]